MLAAIAALLALGAAPAAWAAPASDEAHERYLADFEAACPSPPEPPGLPRGELAGRDDMIDAMRAVKGFDQAAAACYPAELGIDGPQGRLQARIRLTLSGRVRGVEIITATGNSALDEAGLCIARRLRFTPIRVNGMPREGDVAWEIPVRPPAAWIASPPAAQSP